MSRALQSTSASTRVLTARARRERVPSSRRADAFVPRAAAGEAAKSTESALVPGQSSLGRSYAYENEGSRCVMRSSATPMDLRRARGVGGLGCATRD